jgi:hypothetical protein
MSVSRVSHPGLDPGPMNTGVSQPCGAVFMGPGLRRDDSVEVPA